jgi:integrase
LHLFHRRAQLGRQRFDEEEHLAGLRTTRLTEAPIDLHGGVFRASASSIRISRDSKPLIRSAPGSQSWAAPGRRSYPAADLIATSRALAALTKASFSTDRRALGAFFASSRDPPAVARTWCCGSVPSRALFGFSDLRHTHATLPPRGGVDLGIVQRALAHPDPRVKAATYDHSQNL